jgi:hypothetical protein
VVRSRRYLSVLLLATLRTSALAQVWHDDPETLKRVIALHLPNAPGPVAVYYSPEFKARALRYQKALSACKQWYEQQVNTRADFSLAVLNKADWEKVDKSAYPMPHEFSTIVALPGRMEDFPGALTDDLELLSMTSGDPNMEFISPSRIVHPTAFCFASDILFEPRAIG